MHNGQQAVEEIGHGKTHQQRFVGGSFLPLIFSFLILITLPISVVCSPTSQNAELGAPSSALTRRAPNGTLLECIQVSAPVFNPEAPRCEQTLMVHTFGFSYGMPFVGEYIPPPCNFTRVTFNFTVTSAGRQFDRLAVMFFNDTEIWRTSTAEPTAKGIVWTYMKDMSNFLTLFNEPQKIIFDLGNLVDDTYTGSWYTSLTATFWSAETNNSPADVIIPISAHGAASNSSSVFVVPENRAMNEVTLPRNAKKAIFSISSCGQATEEFWWSNVLQSDIDAFGSNTDITLYGHSPFREVQLFIDGILAGVAWPFPIIFTGGIVPGFWRPVVGIDAFDLREDEIDISAFIPLLSDGKAHTFEIKIAGVDDNGQGTGALTEAVGSNWVVTGKIFLWLDRNGKVTTGTQPVIKTQTSLKLGSTRKGVNGSVDSLEYYIKVARSLSITSTVKTSLGSQTATWNQNLAFSNEGLFSNRGNDQISSQTTTGADVSSNQYSKAFDYPLWVLSTYTLHPGGNYSIDGKMTRGKNLRTVGGLAFDTGLETFDFSHSPGNFGNSFVGTLSKNSQNGTASYLAVPAQKKSYGSGTTEQYYSLAGTGSPVATFQDGDNPAVQGGAELYHRHVLAANDSIVFDEETFGDVSVKHRHNAPDSGFSQRTFAEHGIMAMLGRGPAGVGGDGNRRH
ncbi:hypothetical protein P154DRAFT_425593 [Amniculicola lignicola CBS 123094]|uniref:Peptide N-acetyl-beta-D-glucosaminyl asparaginase amidase A N-terminal domain-containing protein n=1 Tax=Amniculicola lignicola CBS 123094 TaxID=1392246 RepID=A0A6A5WVK2_9PLEO|nr:hypothetical protein P154DRAFT_425593 [Amniculicola lignicola CBS 123094]